MRRPRSLGSLSEALMNIAFFTNNYLPNPYGVSASIESFRIELEKRGHAVHVFAPAWKGHRDSDARIHRFPSVTVPYKMKFPIPIPCSPAMKRVFRSVPFEIVHAQHPNILGWVASRWAKSAGVPLVFTWHTMYEQYGHFGPPFVGPWYARQLVRTSVRYARACDAVIVPSRSAARHIATHGVPAEKITVLPSGIRMDDFKSTDRDRVRTRFGIGTGQKVLMTLSRLTAEKNIACLTRCVLRVLRQRPDAVFLVVGSGSASEDILASAKKAGVGDRVILAGEARRDERSEYLSAGDIFVYASKSETQGLAVAEAMYMGLPVAALRATGVEDAVMDKVTGYLADSEDEFVESIARLLDDPVRAKEFGERGSDLIRKSFTSEVCADRLVQMYEQIISKRTDKP